jgi:ketosteroid isomerase-like protein
MSAALKLSSVVSLVLAAPLICVVWSAAKQSREDSRKTLTSAEFCNHMKRLADAWNRGDARVAADLFAEDAPCSSPPNSKVHDSRQELFEWLGGDHGRPKPMQMVWHHLVFDEEQQIRAGEYTFTYGMRTHGMALIRLRDGKIANWREYEIDSPLDWDVLVGKNQF